MNAGFRPFAGFKLAISAYAAIWGTGFLSYLVMPYLIGSVADGMGLEVDQAGLIGSAELLVVALSAFIVSARVRVLPRRKVAMLGGVIAIAGHSLSILTNSIEALIACRVLAGVGAGMALAIGNACLAASHDPSKAYGQVMMLLATVGAGVIVSLGYITEAWSYYGVFGTQAIVVALMLIPMSLLPERDETQAEDDISHGKIPMLPAALIVVGIFLWHFCDNSIWGFSERIATKIGMQPDVIGWLLGGGLLVGVIGGFIASGMGTRYGRIWPICVGVAAAVACVSVITSTGIIPMYTASILIYIVGFMFISSYIYGLAGELDHHGRVMAVASGAGNVGVALAPFLSGRLIALNGYEVMGKVVISTLLIVMALSIVVGSHINRKLRLASPETPSP
ncbi:MAG: MFS transporter [Deltaproteobacteria bacterium]|nr:MFS transporter [Deltaproteobacteria bacterium]